MNSLERYLCTVRGGTPDFPPRTPILMHFAAEHIGATYAQFASDYRVLVRANAACAAEFGIDQLSCISDPYRETQGFGGRVEYLYHAVPRCAPPLAQVGNLSDVPRPAPLQSERMADRVAAVREYRVRWAGEYSILGWVEGPAAEAATLRGPQQFLIDLVKNPGLAGGLMDVCVVVAIDFAREQIRAGADTIGIGDAVASQISPQTYQRLIQPREKRIVQAIQEMGAFAKLHICGDMTHLLNAVAALGVDVLDVDHMVSLEAVRAAVGPQVAICGNIDPVAEVLRGTPESIKAAMRRACATAGQPFMAGAGCEIPRGTPAENLRALCTPIHGWS